MLRLGAAARLLDDADLPALATLLDADPVANCFVAARVETAGLDTRRLTAEVWGYGSAGRLEAACFSGANLVPVGDSSAALSAFAERARRQGRRCSSLVGPAGAVGALWDRLEPYWGPARDVRRVQPVLATSTSPFSIRANDRPASTRSRTRAQYDAPSSVPSGDVPTSSVNIATQDG